MDDGFGYVMQIQDEMSGPAAIEAKSLKSLTAEVKTTEKAIRQLQEAQIKYRDQGIKVSTSNEIAKLRLHRKDLVDAIRERKPDSKEAESSFFPTSAAFLYAQAVAFVARELEHAAVSTVEFAVSSAEFRQNTELAYAAVKGTAAEGKAAFEEIDKAARASHMPAEKAHELARDLMLQGVQDTHLIASTIGAQAALIRTGQEQGAAKLKSIIERSEASGHFDVGKGFVGGKGAAGSGRALAGLGIQGPDLLDNLAKRLGISVDAVKAQLKAGKVAADVGIAAIVDTINQGPIGQAAKGKFGFEDFETDAVNAFRAVAQDTNLSLFTASLIDAESAIEGLTDSNGGLKSTFQAIVDGAAAAVEGIVEFGQEVEIAVLEAQVATLGMTDLSNAFGDLGSILGDETIGVLKAIEFGFVGIVETVDFLTVGIEELGAAFAFVFTGINGFSFEQIKSNLAALQKTAHDLESGLGERTQRRGELLGFADQGSAPIRHGDVREPTSVTTGRDAKVPGFATGGVVPEPKGPDSVFVAARPGETILPRGFDADSIAASVRSNMAQGPAPQPIANTSRPSVVIEAIYVGKEHESGDHLRPILESALADVLERVALEMGA